MHMNTKVAKNVNNSKIIQLKIINEQPDNQGTVFGQVKPCPYSAIPGYLLTGQALSIQRL